MFGSIASLNCQPRQCQFAGSPLVVLGIKEGASNLPWPGTKVTVGIKVRSAKSGPCRGGRWGSHRGEEELEFGILATRKFVVPFEPSRREPSFRPPTQPTASILTNSPTRYRPFDTYSIYRGVPPKRSKDTDPSQPSLGIMFPAFHLSGIQSTPVKAILSPPFPLPPSCPKIQNA